MTLIILLGVAWLFIRAARSGRFHDPHTAPSDGPLHPRKDPWVTREMLAPFRLRLRRVWLPLLVGTASVVAGGVFWGGVGLAAGTLLLAAALAYAASPAASVPGRRRLRLRLPDRFRRRRSRLTAEENAQFEAIVASLSDIADFEDL